MEKKIKITTSKQFQTLISELQKKPNLAKGHHRTSTTNNSKQDWEEIATKLNAIGPPIRDCYGWLRVWRDWKFKVKKKQFKVAQMKAAGNEQFKQLMLHPIEEAVANLMQFQKHLNTEVVLEEQPSVIEIKMEPELQEQDIWDEQENLLSGNLPPDEIKTENYCVLEQTFLENEEDLPLTSVNSLAPEKITVPDRRKRKRNRKNDERQELLKKHNAMQEKIFTEISHTMMELKNILKDTSRYHQKLCEIEEKKLEIMKRRYERDEELFESEMKLKVLEMKIKTKELEAYERK